MLQWSIVELSVYLSGGLKPATETSRILFYPSLVEAGVFPTEINCIAVYALVNLLMTVVTSIPR